MGSEKSGYQKIRKWIYSIGPGIFLMGYNIGTGSVTTMAASGSRYGMSLFWALFLSCLFTFIMLVAYGKFTLISGKTAISSYRNYFGKWFTLFVMFGLILGEIAALMGIMGIIVNLIEEWIFYLSGYHADKIILTLIIISALYYLFWVGQYIKFEKLIVIFVSIMAFSFITSMILVIPDPIEVAKGMVPAIPAGENSHLIAAGMAGTTLSAVLFIMRSIVVQEKGWGPDDLGKEKKDALVSASLMLLLSGAVMACAAGTLYQQGIPVDRAVDMVKTLEPLAGKFAITLFVIGIVSAGISTVFPIILIAPWLISDFTGGKRNIQSKMYRILAGVGILLGLIIPVFGGRPVFIMIASQAFQALLMPLITIAIIILLSKKELIKDAIVGRWLIAGCWATFIFSVVMAYAGFVGLFKFL